MNADRNPIDTLLESLKTHGVDTTIIRGNAPTLTAVTAKLVAPQNAGPHPIYSVIRDMLRHAVKGEGTSGGALEHYPLKDGSVFSVTWITEGDEQRAVLNIAPMGKAY